MWFGSLLIVQEAGIVLGLELEDFGAEPALFNGTKPTRCDYLHNTRMYRKPGTEHKNSCINALWDLIENPPIYIATIREQ